MSAARPPIRSGVAAIAFVVATRAMSVSPASAEEPADRAEAEGRLEEARTSVAPPPTPEPPPAVEAAEPAPPPAPVVIEERAPAAEVERTSLVDSPLTWLVAGVLAVGAGIAIGFVLASDEHAPSTGSAAVVLRGLEP